MKVVNITLTATDKLRQMRATQLGVSTSAGSTELAKKSKALRIKNYERDLETHEAIDEINAEIAKLEEERTAQRDTLHYKSYSKEDVERMLKEAKASGDAKPKGGSLDEEEEEDSGYSSSPRRSVGGKKGPKKGRASANPTSRKSSYVSGPSRKNKKGSKK